MATILTRILRASRRDPGSPLNVLWTRRDPAIDAALLATGHHFWGFGRPIPPDVAVDLVLTQGADRQYDGGRRVAGLYNLPHVTIEHEVPDPRWSDASRRLMAKRRGDLHFFADEEVGRAWGPPGNPLPPDWGLVLRAADRLVLTGAER